MNSYVERGVIDLGKVRGGSDIEARYVLTEGGIKEGIRKVDVGCTCGGKPRISYEVIGGEVVVRTKAKVLGGRRAVVRSFVIEMGNNIRQVLSFKYEVI